MPRIQIWLFFIPEPAPVAAFLATNFNPVETQAISLLQGRHVCYPRFRISISSHDRKRPERCPSRKCSVNTMLILHIKLWCWTSLNIQVHSIMLSLFWKILTVFLVWKLSFWAELKLYFVQPEADEFFDRQPLFKERELLIHGFAACICRLAWDHWVTVLFICAS